MEADVRELMLRSPSWNTMSTDDPHPRYGPCDSFGPDGACSECTGVIAVVIDDTQRLEWLISRLNWERMQITEHGCCDFHSMFPDMDDLPAISREAIDNAMTHLHMERT